MKKIELKGAYNVRELGGTVTMDGRKIKHRRFIRADALSTLTAEDAALLREEYGLSAVIDLRTPTEAREKPDMSMQGVEQIYIPVFDEAVIGISREKKTERSLMENEMPHMAEVYRFMVADSAASSHLAKAVKRIMEHRDGAILWHCTAGKDRCGMTSALILRILGVDMDTIIEDYMRTNDAAMPLAQKLYDRIFAATGSREQAEGVRLAFIADMSYIEAALDEMDIRYGGIDGYIEKALGISQQSIARFREENLI